jgi:DNA-directed RNA polymerase subunit L
MEERDRKIKLLEKKEKELRVEIEGERDTLLAPLTSKLLENENVDIATYSLKHTLMNNSILYVKMKEGDALEAVKSAALSLASDFEEFERKYRAAIV